MAGPEEGDPDEPSSLQSRGTAGWGGGPGGASPVGGQLGRFCEREVPRGASLGCLLWPLPCYRGVSCVCGLPVLPFNTCIGRTAATPM